MSSTADDRVVVVLSTTAYVAFGVYFAAGTLYFCVLFLHPSYRGPCALWRPEIVPERPSPRTSSGRTDSNAAPPHATPSPANMQQVAGPHLMAPLTHRWAYIILHTAPINAIQQLRGYTEMVRFFGINCIQIILFLAYVDDGNTTLAGACAAIIMCLCTMAVICFIQSVRLIYHLDFLVMVLPRRNRTKEEIESEALGLAVGIADHAEDELKRQDAAACADKKILDEATERFAASLRRRATVAAASGSPPADASWSAMAGGPVATTASPPGQEQQQPSGSPMSIAVERMSAIAAENPGLILRHAKEEMRRRRELNRRSAEDDDREGQMGSPSSPTAQLRSSTREPTCGATDESQEAQGVRPPDDRNCPRPKQGTMKELVQQQESIMEVSNVVPASFARSADDGYAAFEDAAYVSPVRPATECYDDENRSSSSSSSTPVSREYGSSSRSGAGTNGNRYLPTPVSDDPLSRQCMSDVDPREAELMMADARRREEKTAATNASRLPLPPGGGGLTSSQSAGNLRSRSGSGKHHHPRTISIHSHKHARHTSGSQHAMHDDRGHHHHHRRHHGMPDLDISEIAVANMLTKPSSAGAKASEHARGASKSPGGVVLVGASPSNDTASVRNTGPGSPVTTSPGNNSFVSPGSFSYTQAEYAARLIAHLALEERLSYEQHEQRLGILMKMLSGNTVVGIRLMIFCLPPLLGMFHEVAMIVGTAAAVAVAVYADRGVM